MSTQVLKDYFNFLAPTDIRLKGTREEQRINPPPVSEQLRQLTAKRKTEKSINES